MTKLAAPLAAAALLTGFAGLAPPAVAQQGQQIAEVIVYGNDPCPRSTDDEVVVCARKPEAERYRIPERLRTSGTRQERDSWANRARSFETVGRTGTMSCSPVGPGGFTGCLTRVIREAREDRRQQAEDYNPER